MQRTVTLIGPFTDMDLATIMDVLRYCERKQPEEKFLMTIEDTSDKPVQDMKEFLKDRFPAVKGVPVTVETFERK